MVNLSALGPDDDLNDLLPSINSYLGHFGHADSYRLRQQLCKTVSQYDISNTCVVLGDYGSLKNTSTTKLRNHVLNATISDLFSTAAFGLFADSSADSSADSEGLWDYDGHHSVN